MRFERLDNKGKSASVYALGGEVYKGSDFECFGREVLGDLRAGLADIIIDFNDVYYINSSGIGVLCKLNNDVVKSGGNITIVNLQHELASVFIGLNLFKILPYAESVDLALAKIE